MNALIRVATACALVASAPSLVSAQEEIVVQPPSKAVWAARMGRALSRDVGYPQRYHGAPYAQGTALVRFLCSDAGVPAGAALVRSSGDHGLDRAALRAVNRLKLHPLPAAVGHDQRFAAAIVFATSQASLDRQLDALRRDPALRAVGRDTVALAAAAPAVAR